MLRDGTRQGMKGPTFDVIKRIDTLSNQWTRAVLDARLVTMMKSQVIKNLNTLQDGHGELSRSSLGEKSERAGE